MLFEAARFDALTKMRVPWTIKDKAQRAGKAEVVWRVPRPAGQPSEIFTHLLTSYSGLENQGFDFDQYRVKSPPITSENVAQRAQLFAQFCSQWAGYFNSSGSRMLALPWGGDMRWQNASFYFQNMTLLIEHVNARPDEYGLRVLYATPSEYFTALNSRTRNRRWPMVQGDVFTPYDNNMKTRALQGFETGIYDSQTEEKRWTRRTMNTLRAADLSHALAHAHGLYNGTGLDEGLLTARQAVGIGVHHDAIPGTSNTGKFTGSDPIHGGWVVQDYVNRLKDGTRAALRSLERSMSLMHAGAPARALGGDEVLDVSGAAQALLLFNPSQRKFSSAFSVRVRSTSGVLSVWDSDGNDVLAQLDVIAAAEGLWRLTFLAVVPAFGTATFSVGVDGQHAVAQHAKRHSLGTSTFTLRGGCAQLTLDKGGLLSVETVTESGQTVRAKMRTEFVMYTNTSSGSYFFTPNSPATPVATGPAVTSIDSGPLLTTVRQEYAETGLTQTLELRTSDRDKLCAAITLQSGIRKGLAYGNELAVRLLSDLDNSGDSSPLIESDDGIALVGWRYNASCVSNFAGPCEHKDVLGGNYRAALSRARISSPDLTLELFLDRTHGVASLARGMIELKLQRNVGADGEGPACNDTAPLVAPMQLLLTPANGGNAWRSAVRANVSDPVLAFHVPSPTQRSSALSTEFVLPDGIRLASLRWKASTADGTAVLIRFVNYGTESCALDLGGMFAPPLRMSKLVETTLTGTEILQSATQRRLQWATNESDVLASALRVPQAEETRPEALAVPPSRNAIVLAAHGVHTFSAVLTRS